MTELITERRQRSVSGPAHTADTLSTLAIVSFVGAVLWIGREILVPIAFAILLSFVLAPLVRLLRRLGVGRAISVSIVVIAAFLVILGIGVVFTRQMTQLASELPSYESTVARKINAARGAATHSGVIEKITEMMRKLGSQIEHPSSANERRTSAPAPARNSSPETAPIPVTIQQPASTPMGIVMDVALKALGPLTTAGIVLIFVIFILLQREDLRDRIIRLAGARDLQRTTAAIDDAARRLSRYFLAQTMVNSTFGLVIGSGLWLIGVPSAPLWGIMAMILRFVPYIGPVAAAVFPLLLSAAVAPGWTKTVETAALFVVVEPITGQFIEPFFYGHSTGLSPIAVIISATLWTWLWGPVGLVLSTPLTVCLVVLGRHVDQLQVLDVLLGNAPPLTLEETFYQRALAGHPHEAIEEAERYLKTASLPDYFNLVALPALHLAQADVRRGTLDETRQRKLYETIEDLADALSDHPQASRASTQKHSANEGAAAADASAPALSAAITSVGETIPESWKTGRAALCVAGRSALDGSASLMLATLLSARGVAAVVEPGELLTARRLNGLDLAGVRLICLSYFDANLHPAHVRFIVRRLRRRGPSIKIIGGFWSDSQRPADVKELCQDSGVDAYAADLIEALSLCLGTMRSTEHNEQIHSIAPAIA